MTSDPSPTVRDWSRDDDAPRLRPAHGAAEAPPPLEQRSAERDVAAAIVRGAATPMCLCWGEDLVLAPNDAWLDRFGGHDPQTPGRVAREAFAGHWPRIGPVFEAVLAGGPAEEIAGLRLPLGGGEPAGNRWFDIGFSPVPLRDGRVGGVLVLAAEVTALHAGALSLRHAEARHREELRRHTEEATRELKASHDLLQATMDASTDMIQVFHAVRDRSGQIVDFHWVLNNHTSESRYGEVRRQTLLTRNPGVVAEGIFDCFRRVTETGVPEQAERRYVHEQFDGWFYQSVVKLNDGVATTTREISDWKHAQAEVMRLQDEAAKAALRESEERFLSFAENSTNVLWIVDADTHRIVYLSPAYEQVWGETRERVIAEDTHWSELVHPEDRALALAVLPRALAGERTLTVYRIVRPDDGSTRWVQDTGFPIRNAQGRIFRVGGIVQDVTEQREIAEKLRENQRRLQAVIEGIPQLVWRTAEGGHWTWSSPQWLAYTGQSEGESRGLGWLDALHPADRERARAGWLEADGTAPVDMETRLYHAAEKRYRWFQTRALPVRSEDGSVIEWLGTSTDVDDLFQLREHQQILHAELQHRTRNLIGVIRNIAERTAANAGSLGDFLPRYKERLGALSRINTLLSLLETGERITFGNLIRNELEARGVLDDEGARRIVLEGPEGVRLRSSSVQIFALAIHELTTNAVKYGALTAPGGHLAVRWRTWADENGAEHLQVDWIESGLTDLPELGAPAQGGGFGRMLIERALPYQLRARTTYEFLPDGLRCTIDLPLR